MTCVDKFKMTICKDFLYACNIAGATENQNQIIILYIHLCETYRTKSDFEPAINNV